MAGIIKKQILKHLSRFAKNLSPDKINLSTLKGEGQLTNLELDEEVLQNVLDLPTWLAITRVYCNKAGIRIQWTKLKTHPICLYLDKVEVEMRTCEEPRPPNGPSPIALAAGQSEYGFAEKVVEGMFITVNSITIKIQAKAFHASFELWQLQGYSVNPIWEQSDLRFTRITDPQRGEVLTFKKLTWQTLRIEADAIESGEQDFASTPLRLITNQGKIQVALKRRIKDCNVVATKLMVLLDDLLWVLTDLQLKAMIKYAKSLTEAIEKSSQQRKSLAPDILQATSPTSTSQQMRSQQATSTGTPNSVSNYFERFDVRETSYHLLISRLDLHICDDGYSKEPAEKRRITGGAVQLTFRKLGFDYYPFHWAGDSCRHWERHCDAMERRSKWAKELLKEFQAKVESYKVQTASASANPLAADVHFIKKDLLSSPKKSPPERDKTNGHPSAPPALGFLQPQWNRLRSSCLVIRVDDLDVYQVSTAGHHGKKPSTLLSCNRKSLHLPANISAIHMEFTEYYFPDGQKIAVPCPNLYMQLNGLQFTLDFLSILWLNRFALNLYQSLQQFKAIYMLEDSNKEEHMDIRMDGFGLKFIIPVEKKVTDHPDRPQSLVIQMTTMTTTNTRHSPHCSRADLQQVFRTFAASEFFHSTFTQFPKTSSSFNVLQTLFLHHAYEVESKLQTHKNFTPDTFKMSSSEDIWSVHFAQLALHFEGALTSKGKPFSFVDPFPLCVWVCRPTKFVQSQLVERMIEPSGLKAQIKSSISFSNHIDCDHFTVRLGNSQRSRTVHELRDVAPMESNTILVEGKPLTKHLDAEAFAELHLLVQTEAHVKLRLNHYQYLVLLRLKEMLTELQEELALDTQEITGTQLESMSCCIGVTLTSAEIALLLQPIPTSSYEAKSTDSDSSSLTDSDLSPSGSREALATEEKGLTNEMSIVKSAAGSTKGLEDSGIENVEASIGSAAGGDLLPLHRNGTVTNTHVVCPTVNDTENVLDGGSVEEAFEAEESLHSETAAAVNEVGLVCDNQKCPASPSTNSLSLKSRSTSFSGSAELIPLKHLEVELTGALNLTKDVTKEALKEAVSITKDAFSISREKMTATMQRMMSLPPARDLTSKREENAVVSTTTGSSKLRTVMMNRTASQQSFDSTSLDGSLLDDRLSVDSDGSENFVILSDIESGVESDLLSHPLEDTGSRPSALDRIRGILDGDGKTSPDITSSASHSTEESNQDMASVVVLKMSDVNCGIDVRGDDLAVMVQALEVVPDQLGNVVMQQYLDSSSAGDLGFQKLVSEITRTCPQMCLRLESGPAAAAHSPLAVRNGFLHLKINSYNAELLLSSLNNIVPFLEDEIIPEVIPMKIEIVDTQVTLKDDGPRVYPTSPGPVPVTFAVDRLTMQRIDDGTFCIKVAPVDHLPSVTNHKRSSLSMELDGTKSKSPQDGSAGRSKEASLEDQYEQLKNELESTRMALARAKTENERLLCEVKKHNPEFHL
ncbi:UHRF1-binding protein 1 [Protopterus annectens]|uniref:UHRF1-binding protein 1 n=1 Tax=Protopterus annectens TaxID=7888 RepID=UPI001CFA7BCB|nr:UHRF1-binding protein 1 [Protopterus annectens]